MQIKIFDIPIGADEGQIDELNHFLRANKVIDVQKELAQMNGNSIWTFCITYMPSNRPTKSENASHSGSNKIDYKEVLDPEIFEKFSLLRKMRKQIADSEAIPAYAIFTDSELAEMAKLPQLTPETMMTIPGIGKKKVEKYGTTFQQIAFPVVEDEASGLFDG